MGTERKYEKPVRISCPSWKLYLRNTSQICYAMYKEFGDIKCVCERQ